ncbi:MAG: hypothetical protein ABSG79_22490 [Bryobacteraceae bacterium]
MFPSGAQRYVHLSVPSQVGNAQFTPVGEMLWAPEPSALATNTAAFSPWRSEAYAIIDPSWEKSGSMFRTLKSCTSAFGSPRGAPERSMGTLQIPSCRIC